jgi:transposase
MLTNLLLPWLSGFRLDTIVATDTIICLELTTLFEEACCPLCGQSSRAIHSRYQRTVADLPWASTSVRLSLHVRKFFCRNGACSRVVFAERLPALVAPSARRSQRLGTEQRHLALDQGGEAGARTATRQGMPVSPRTLLRLARRTPALTHPTPKILGVDDFAFRKGQTYGTLLVDLQRHQPIDMLADRSADTLADWLTRHPGVAIITRDRARDYADGATRGAPSAIQVADRFHLVQNTREMLQRLLERQQASLRLAGTPVATEQGSASAESPLPSEPVAAEVPALVRLAEGERALQAAAVEVTPVTSRSHARRTQRQARYDTVRDLHAQGLSIRAIAQHLHMGRQTVRRFLVADHFPERASRRKAPSKLDPFVPYLRQQLAAGSTNGMQLWRDLRDHHGYDGSRALVSRWVAQHRHLSPANAEAADQPKRRGRPPRPHDGSQPAAVRIVSARQAAWLLVRRPDDLEDDDCAFVERLCQICPAVQTAYPLAQEFLRIVRERHVDALESWLTRAGKSGIPEIQSFVVGLRRDQAAIAAALTLPFSNGQVEGQVNRLKFIKRSGYGRMKLDLLRQRVLAA